MSAIEPGTLYVCATPIGNLSDITLRVLEVLQGVDLIAAEDTRYSRKLLARYEIKTPVTSCHEHNERARTPELVDRLRRGQTVALVSDAGMPGISDPGSILMEACREQGIAVDVLPGPNAAVTALVLSGLSKCTYFYGGFLPVGKKRKRALGDLAGLSCTLVFYEAPHRLVRTLRDLLGVLGDRDAAVCRELTKVHQQVHRGTLQELIEEFEGQAPRGECCLVVAGTVAKTESEIEVRKDDEMRRIWAELTENGMEAKEAVKETAQRLGVPKRCVYQAVRVKGARDT
ncbi:MAG: 16S rRNA (cytidine(1402)-2'-O)-methyltransferase [Peptococcaceae bacterium]|nr:16S rRNA (cytidine(1402)-2'-O)-methyltransferase [Peptococcaceae bacterium]